MAHILLIFLAAIQLLLQKDLMLKHLFIQKKLDIIQAQINLTGMLVLMKLVIQKQKTGQTIYMENQLNVMVKLLKLQHGQKKSLVLRLQLLKHLQNILQKFLMIITGVVFHYYILVVSKEIQKASRV